METDSDDDKSSDSGKDLAIDVDSESNSCTNLSNVEASSNTTPRRDFPTLARTCDRHGISELELPSHQQFCKILGLLRQPIHQSH